MKTINTVNFIVERISALRVQKGVSELQMSRDLGKSPNYLYYIRKNKNTPSLPVLEKICEYLGVTLTQFFDIDYNYPSCINDISKLLMNFSPQELDNIKEFLAFASDKKKG